jgi:hypothetical protein
VYSQEIVKRLKEYVQTRNIRLNDHTVDSFNLVDAIQQGKGTGSLLRTGVEVETNDPKWNWNSDKLLKYPPHPPEVKLEAFSSAKRILHDSKGAWERIDGLLVSLTCIMKKVESILGPRVGTSLRAALEITTEDAFHLDLPGPALPSPGEDGEGEGASVVPLGVAADLDLDEGKKKVKVATEDFEEFVSHQSKKKSEDRISISEYFYNRHCECMDPFPTTATRVVADLSEQKIVGLVVENLDLTGAIFCRGELQDIRFVGTNLTDVSFVACSFRRVSFEESYLLRTDFTNAIFHVTDSPVSTDDTRSHLSKKLIRDMRVRKIAYLDLQFRALRAILEKVRHGCLNIFFFRNQIPKN